MNYDVHYHWAVIPELSCSELTIAMHEPELRNNGIEYTAASGMGGKAWYGRTRRIEYKKPLSINGSHFTHTMQLHWISYHDLSARSIPGSDGNGNAKAQVRSRDVVDSM